ncbi:MAG TPA: hypothetical protein VFQ67_07655 [Allosphingosinicella sp.]|jgi:hypothetical protein|nr:hypothetical protein [Allosphingosinicella sp.]
MSALLAALAAWQATAQAEEPAKPRLPYSIEFARAQIGAWEAEASSYVEDETGVPMLGYLFCEIRRSGVMLRTWREGHLYIYFGGYNLKSEMPELGVGAAEVRRIELDGSGWEYRWLGRWPEDRQFADLSYPPPPRPPANLDPIHHPIGKALSGWIAVRRGPGSPWVSANVLANRLVRARRLRIGYVEEDRDPEPDEGPLLWAEMSLDGLGDAFAWCDSAMDGDRARHFHADLDP